MGRQRRTFDQITPVPPPYPPPIGATEKLSEVPEIVAPPKATADADAAYAESVAEQRASLMAFYAGKGTRVVVFDGEQYEVKNGVFHAPASRESEIISVGYPRAD